MSQIDILAIGDLVIDAFIKLEDAEVNCRLNNVECELCVRYGDKVPYESVEVCTAVGNSPNAAVSASRLGLGSALFAYVGNDENGKACIAELEKNGVDTRFVKVEDGKKTNYHYVLWYDVDRTILVKHDAFSYKLGDIDGPKWIYLSSLGSNSGPLHDEIADYLEKNPDTKLAFQPGTFQMKMGKEKLARIYGKTEAFFCNVEEAQLILDDKSRDLKTLLSGLRALGPKIVVITDGFNGAYALDADGKTYFMPIYPHTPFERTGAGDAYASTAVACLAMGKTLAEALTWAPINSMSVVQQVGAQKGLLTEDKLKEYLANAPAEYKLKEI
jgi:sugar/nucleoside kinase (ribokinase family)